MQPRRAALPEFDGPWLQSVTAPVRWPCRCLNGGKALFGLGKAQFQGLPAGNGLALWRSPGAEAGRSRTLREVTVRFCGRNARHLSTDTHLTFELRPEKQQARLRVLHQLSLIHI